MLEEYSEISVKKIRGDGFITLARFDDESKFMYMCDQESDVIKKIDLNDFSSNILYTGHEGIIWDISQSDKDMMASVSGDMTYIIWEISTGNIISKKAIENGIPKIVRFNKSSDKLAISINSFGKSGKNKIFLLNNISKENISQDKCEFNVIYVENVVSAMEWDDDNLLVGYQNGLVNIFDTKNDNKKLIEIKLHDDCIKMFDKSSKYKDIWLSASSDCTAKEFNINTFEIVNIYKHDYPINVAKYNLNNRKIYLGGGLDAMEVAKNNNNDLTLKIFKRHGKMTNIINGHFGPIRDLSFSKVNNNFITASQDGTVILHLIDNNLSEKIESNESNEIIEVKALSVTLTTKEKLINDIFGNMSKSKDKSKGEIKNDIIRIKNLGFRSPKIKNEGIFIPGMVKPESIIKQEKFEKNLKEHKPKSEGDMYDTGDSKMYEKRELYGIKIFGMCPESTKEDEIRDIFENFGRIAGGRSIKLIKSEREYSKMNGIKQKYSDMMVIINYLSKDSAERAVSNMNKKAFGQVLIDVQHCT